jgi:hypothetical protein
MEDLAIFRLFLAFPLIGLLIPDAGSLISNFKTTHIPAAHVIIGITLLICMVVCSVGTKYLKRKILNSVRHNDKLLIEA